jgi:multidrug efflux pump subunit AcrA (membrane-fusion protein)
LPLSALFNEGGKLSFYVVDDNGALTLRPVTVKAYESNDVIITSGVEEGAKIVALGVQKLDPSLKVRVVSSLSF